MRPRIIQRAKKKDLSKRINQIAASRESGKYEFQLNYKTGALMQVLRVEEKSDLQFKPRKICPQMEEALKNLKF